jgi:hypothetical protein
MFSELDTESRDRVAATPPSYSESPGFKSLFRDRQTRLRIFVVFLCPSRQTLRQYPKLGQDRVLPHPFQLNVHQSTLYSLSY